LMVCIPLFYNGDCFVVFIINLRKSRFGGIIVCHIINSVARRRKSISVRHYISSLDRPAYLVFVFVTGSCLYCPLLFQRVFSFATVFNPRKKFQERRRLLWRSKCTFNAPQVFFFDFALAASFFCFYAHTASFLSFGNPKIVAAQSLLQQLFFRSSAATFFLCQKIF
jgi:hypothetical protein